jgi:hypothetical protein
MDRLRKEEFMPIATVGSWRDPAKRAKSAAKAPTTFDNINGNEQKRTGTKSNEKPVKSTKAA